MIKKITIKSEKDLKKFYKKLKWYRGFLYYFTIFKTNDNEIKDIIEALNIKNKKERIIYVYNNACDKIDDMIKKCNICGFKKCICYKGHINGCCRRCKFQSNKGCITRNLACKLFNCTEVKKRHQVITFDDLKILKTLSYQRQSIIKYDYFTLYDDVIKDLYFGSITIFVIRFLFRTLKNSHMRVFH